MWPFSRLSPGCFFSTASSFTWLRSVSTITVPLTITMIFGPRAILDSLERRPPDWFVLVQTDERTGEQGAGAGLAAVPEVLEVHHVAGQDSYLVKVRVRDPESLGRLLRERFGAIPGVRSTMSTIALETLKESWVLPLEPLPMPDRERLRA